MSNEENEENEFSLEDLKKNSDGKYILPLIRPFTWGKGECARQVTELVLATPKAKHLRKLPTNPGMNDILKIIGSLAGEADSVIDDLEMVDCNRAVEYFSLFG